MIGKEDLETLTNDELRQVRNIINQLLYDPKPSRAAASKRLQQLRAVLSQRMGDDPFKPVRLRRIVLMRFAIWHLMRQEGFSLHSIAEACGWNHSTVWQGDQQIEGLLSYGEREATCVWNTLIKDLPSDRGHHSY